jgi:L-aspartate oxidase
LSERRDFEFLVIGSGIAGLFYALRVAERGRVAVVTKRRAFESATHVAQGGIAAVLSKEDSFEDHVRDTLNAGAGLCHTEVVQHVIQRGPAMIEALVELGARFDRHSQVGDSSRELFDLGREGGHTRRRILHHRDTTGREIERALLERAQAHPNVSFFEHHLAIDLICSAKLGLPSPNRALGAYILNAVTGRIERFLAPITLLATGGAGKVYLYTSNPDVASGDGLAMAYRAGATLANMEFMQFHPTCLYHPEAKSFLITEAVRGEGGTLRMQAGETFMARYHPMKDLAPRDVVARAIDTELKRSGDEYVLLDITARDPGFVRERFPNIHQRCLTFGIDITKQPIPVVPAAHYCCGGVWTDLRGETDVANLFSAGEVACTGLHGANRLASNSLLEALVFAEAAAVESAARLDTLAPLDERAPPWQEGSATESDEAVVITQKCGYRAQRQATGASPQPDPPAAGGNHRVLLELPRHAGPDRASQPRARGRTGDRVCRAATREPRPPLQHRPSGPRPARLRLRHARAPRTLRRGGVALSGAELAEPSLELTLPEWD